MMGKLFFAFLKRPYNSFHLMGQPPFIISGSLVIAVAVEVLILADAIEKTADVSKK